MSILALTSNTLVGTATAGNLEYNGQFYGTDSAAARAQMQRITLATAVASTSGTSIDFTSIPSWVKRITVMFNEMSTSGSSDRIVQLGTSSGIQTTGYKSTGMYAIASGNGMIQATTGLLLGKTDSASASINFTGHMVITLISGSSWVASALGGGDYPLMLSSAGNKTLSGTLDRVRITTVNGTDTFDAGSINILYEG